MKSSLQFEDHVLNSWKTANLSLDEAKKLLFRELSTLEHRKKVTPELDSPKFYLVNTEQLQKRVEWLTVYVHSKESSLVKSLEKL